MVDMVPKVVLDLWVSFFDSGDSSEDDKLRLMVVLKQQVLTLIRAVLLMGLDGGVELFDFVIVKQGW